MTLRRFAPSLFACLLAVALAPRAAAHDWWLEVGGGAAVGESVDVAATVGVAFAGERVARDPKRIRRFVALDAQGERPVDGAPGSDPLGRVELRAAGTTLVAYESEPARLFLRAPEFESYLREEGLEAIVAKRAARGESAKMGLERYSRCAKALARTRGAPLLDRSVGLPLELVAEGDLASLAAGGTLRARLLWNSKPLAGALVVAIERGHPDAKVAARSDADGNVALVLPRGGFWLVKTVHMVEAPAETRLDWESWWASLTFDVAPPPAAARSE